MKTDTTPPPKYLLLIREAKRIWNSRDIHGDTAIILATMSVMMLGDPDARSFRHQVELLNRMIDIQIVQGL